MSLDLCFNCEEDTTNSGGHICDKCIDRFDTLQGEKFMSENGKEEKKETLPAYVPVAEGATDPEAILALAVSKGASIEMLDKLLDLRQRVKAEQAKEAFNEAMSRFHGMVPSIPKKRKVMSNNGSLRYKYASLDDIVSRIKDPLAECGLSYSWKPVFARDPKGAPIEQMTCIVKHVLGHSEESLFEVPVELSNFMTTVQSYGSASTYAKRYSLCNALGITPDDDDDAISTGKTFDVSPNAKSDAMAEELKQKRAAAASPSGVYERLSRAIQIAASIEALQAVWEGINAEKAAKTLSLADFNTLTAQKNIRKNELEAKQNG